MGFRFSLETLLRLRRSLEDDERLRLQALLAQRAQLEREVRESIESRTALNAKLQAAMHQALVSGSEMHFAGQRQRGCEAQAARLNAAAELLAQPIEQQQTVLLRRRLERRVLEQVRERQLARYQTEAERRAQVQLEEQFLLRRFPRIGK
jgi:flagellar export protein FliJ